VLFVQGVHAFENSASPAAPPTIALIWAGLALVSGWSWRSHATHGPGYVEGRLNHWFQPIFKKLAVLLAVQRNYRSPSAGTA
jgi:hypothetical protein